MKTYKRDTWGMQGYQVLATPTGEKVANVCAQFEYKGYQISFSTNGYDDGACLNEIIIFDKNDDVVDAAQSVQAAIQTVDFITRIAD